MKRCALVFAFAISVLVTLTVASVWVRTTWREDHVRLRIGRGDSLGDGGGGTYRGTELGLITHRQHVRFFLLRQDMPSARAMAEQRTIGWSIRRSGDPSVPDTISPDFGHWSIDDPPQLRMWHVHGPMWLAVAVPAGFATLFAYPLWRAARRRRGAASGLCGTCSYDLRGAKHERCPECGHLVLVASHGEPSPLSKMK